MVALSRPALASSLALVGTSAYGIGLSTELDLSEHAIARHTYGIGSSAAAHAATGTGTGTGTGTAAAVLAGSRQTPEELGFSDAGDVDDADNFGSGEFSEEFCLDIGAKGFPIPTFDMLKAANWDAATYFEQLQMAGYAEDALQMTGPGKAVLKSDCMREGGRLHGRMKHIFVGDSQMMSLRNAFHRLNKCPEIWWSNHTSQEVDTMMQSVHQIERTKHQKGQVVKRSRSRFHSRTEQTPDTLRLPQGCKEEGIATFIHWDGWATHELPVDAIKKEMELLGVSPADGDTVVVWVGSNFIPARHRMSALLRAVSQLHEMKVKMVWDSPAFHDEVLMAATTTHDAGRSPLTNIPVTLNSIHRRKLTRQMGSNEFGTERELYEQGIEIPTTKRWQITNRYRGLQCDGIHTDMRARDPLFYDMPCPMGEQRYGQSSYCTWVEPFKKELSGVCPWAYGLDDMVLQSGLYAMCAAHEQPFCYYYTENIR